jgi:signal transduction histidine kinase
MGAVEFVRDITERKRLEEELLRAMRRTEAANRAKSRFLANMSHEIRTPLNAVLGYIQLVLHEDLSPKAAARLRVAEESAQNLLSVINDILDYSKIEAGKFDIREQSVDPREIVASLVKQQDILARNKGLSLTFDIAPDVPRRCSWTPCGSPSFCSTCSATPSNTPRRAGSGWRCPGSGTIRRFPWTTETNGPPWFSA